MSSPNTPPTLPPRRSFRVSLEAALAGLIALALIVVVLAGIFSLGERRLGSVQTATPAVVPALHPPRATPGLQAPAALPQARMRPVNPSPKTAENELAPPSPEPQAETAGAQPVAPPPVASPAPVAIAPRVEAAAPTAAAPMSEVRPRISLGDYLGYVQFTKIRDAYLNHPDPLVNPAKVERPQATGELAEARTQSRLTPQAVRELVAERQAMQSLSQLRSQARIDPSRLHPPATQPSPQ